MPRRKWPSLWHFAVAFGFCLSLMLLASTAIAWAQESGGQSQGRLIISSSDASSAPTIVLRAYGMDEQGSPLVLSSSSVVVTHDGQAVSNVETVGDYQAGTFTIFVVDVPPGVEAQLPDIQQAIENYASPPEMQERVDYLAIYRVNESQAGQLLAPTNFYNTVRNFFAEPLELQTGPTALVDSLGILLDEAETLKPKDDMVTSIVVLTDGTDAVSTQYDAEELGRRATELGIPIHTIWLENANLQAFSQEAGRDYLTQLAAESRGIAARLDQPTEVQRIWGRIASFRNHAVIQYVAENLAGGEYEVVLSMQSNPDLQASTTVNVAQAAPSVVINLPPESRELTLDNLETPVALSFSTTVSWLDGVERALASAELLVNGQLVQSIDIDNIDRFTAEIANFSYGPNTIQVAITDELGQQATSPAIRLTVLEGATEVPEEIQAEGLLSPTMLRVVLGCFVLLLLLVLLAFLILLGRRWGIFERFGLDRLTKPRRGSADERPGARRVSQPRQEPAGAASGTLDPNLAHPTSPDQESYGTGVGAPYLEILESVTRMPQVIELTAVEHRIGRSPVQADIVFENDITVSRIHASIVLEGNDYRLYDEGSTSGTLVNDQNVPEYGRQLMNGDEIRLGAARMRFRR